MSQHLETRCGALEESGNRRTDRVGHQQAGGVAHVFLTLGGLGGLAGQVVGDARVQHRAVGRGQGLGQQALQVGLDGDDVELFDRAVNLLNDRRGQAHADAASQLLGTLGEVERGLGGSAVDLTVRLDQ